LRSGKHEVSRTKDDPRYGRGTCSEPAGPAMTTRCDDRHAVDAVSDCPAQATALYDATCHVSSGRWTSVEVLELHGTTVIVHAKSSLTARGNCRRSQHVNRTTPMPALIDAA
jgi:hypothetical protein